MSDLHAQLEHLIDELLANGLTLQQARDEFERQYAVQARQKARGNATRAAQALGIHRNTLLKLAPSARVQRRRERQLLSGRRRKS